MGHSVFVAGEVSWSSRLPVKYDAYGPPAGGTSLSPAVPLAG